MKGADSHLCKTVEDCFALINLPIEVVAECLAGMNLTHRQRGLDDNINYIGTQSLGADH